MARLLAAAAAAGLLWAAPASAALYLHNPRGSQNRNCERNVNRANAARLFDGGGNAKGGYACPRDDSSGLYFLTGSVLPIEWTVQHGCGGNPKVQCEIVLQYACEDTLDPSEALDALGPGTGPFRTDAHAAAPRDGAPRDADDDATDTIPDFASAVPDSTERRRFGVHESPDFYDACAHRQRNNGVFTADQNVRRRDARGTRQNPDGNRFGFECPEERDYYPHWAPSGSGLGIGSSGSGSGLGSSGSGSGSASGSSSSGEAPGPDCGEQEDEDDQDFAVGLSIGVAVGVAATLAAFGVARMIRPGKRKTKVGQG